MVPDFARFVVRAVRPGDAGALLRLARHLDSYNLPADARRLGVLVSDTARSFAGRLPSRAREKYIFVLEDRARRTLAGCSMIVAKHGAPGSPHIYLRTFRDVKRSRFLGRAVVHHCLQLGEDADGPTELGGLVLAPAYRGRPEKLGRFLSYGRLLFIAARRKRFENRLLAEYLPAFLQGKRSPFWDYFGAKFTGLSYHQADRLSMDSKEFILSLFPRETIYVDFFPPEVKRYLGHVGEESVPASSLLARQGFRYADQIEPFDGGPCFMAATDRVPLVRRARRGAAWEDNSPGGEMGMVLRDGTEPRLVCCPLRRGQRGWGLSGEGMEVLSLQPGDEVWGGFP
jgi:arginine N-succinyltransferase